MAKVLVLSTGSPSPFDPWNHGAELLLRHAAEVDSFGEHSLTEDPQQADIILFAEMGRSGKFAELIRAHSYYRKYPDKCFLFDSSDVFFPVLPGIYASLTEQQYQAGHTRTGFYLYVIENAFIRHRPLTGQEPYLAAFVGSRKNAPVREKLFALNQPNFLIRDTSDITYKMQYHGQSDERACFWSDYADSIANAKFSLCPRGAGPGSIRLFESMKTGRACVILADTWHRQKEIDWDSFSLTVRESDVDRLPEILERNEHRAREMGEAARLTWETQFSERVRFHRAVEACLDILRHRRLRGPVRRYYHLRHIANPRNWRWYLSSKKELYRVYRRFYW